MTHRLREIEIEYLKDKREKLNLLPEIDEETQREINRLSRRIWELMNKRYRQ